MIWRVLARLWARVFRFTRRKEKVRLSQGACNNPIIDAGTMHHGRIQP